MPLSWVFSSVVLLVVMVVALFLYSVYIIEIKEINSSSGEINFFLWW